MSLRAARSQADTHTPKQLLDFIQAYPTGSYSAKPPLSDLGKRLSAMQLWLLIGVGEVGGSVVREFMNRLRACEALHNIVPKAFLLFLALACTAMVSAAQTTALSPYQDEEDGVGAGGKWMQFRSVDKMTGAKRFRFELRSGSDPREESDYEPRVELFCSDGKFKQAYFDTGSGLGPPNRPGFWGQPQMQVLVRVDNTHESHGWNWVRGRFLSMDKGTVRGLIGAKVFKVQVETGSGQEIAEFSPAGLKLDRVKQACALTPKKPSK